MWIVVLACLLTVYAHVSHLAYRHFLQRACSAMNNVVATMVMIFDPLPAMVFLKLDFSRKEWLEMNASPCDGLVTSTSPVICSQCNKSCIPHAIDIVHVAHGFYSTTEPWKRIRRPLAWVTIAPAIAVQRPPRAMGIFLWPAFMAWKILKMYIILPWKGKHFPPGMCIACSAPCPLVPISNADSILSNTTLSLYSTN